MDTYDVLESEKALQKFNELLDSVSPGEIEQWRYHACTKALLFSLLHSEMVYMENWSKGAFTSESADGTAQQNAKALGALEAISIMKQYIKEEISAYDNGNGA